MSNIDQLSCQLNSHSANNGTQFDAVILGDGETLEVIASNNPDFPIFVSSTERQILSVTPLFKVSDVKEGEINSLNSSLLKLSPVVPLSSIGLQGDQYILHGAMAVGTLFENIAHELETQADNTLDVLDALSPFLK